MVRPAPVAVALALCTWATAVPATAYEGLARLAQPPGRARRPTPLPARSEIQLLEPTLSLPGRSSVPGMPPMLYWQATGQTTPLSPTIAAELTGFIPKHIPALHRAAQRGGAFGVRVVRGDPQGRADNFQRLDAGLRAKPLIGLESEFVASDYDLYVLIQGNSVMVEGLTPKGLVLPDPRVLKRVYELNKACLAETPHIRPVFAHGAHWPDHMHALGPTRGDVVFFDGKAVWYVAEHAAEHFIRSRWEVPAVLPEFSPEQLQEAYRAIHDAVGKMVY